MRVRRPPRQPALGGTGEGFHAAVTPDVARGSDQNKNHKHSVEKVSYYCGNTECLSVNLRED